MIVIAHPDVVHEEKEVISDRVHASRKTVAVTFVVEMGFVIGHAWHGSPVFNEVARVDAYHVMLAHSWAPIFLDFLVEAWDLRASMNPCIFKSGS